MEQALEVRGRGRHVVVLGKCSDLVPPATLLAAHLLRFESVCSTCFAELYVFLDWMARVHGRGRCLIMTEIRIISFRIS